MWAVAESIQRRLPTTVVGSYPQPDWLIDRARLGARLPPRIRALELWRVAQEVPEKAQDDATRSSTRATDRAGLDILTDGAQRRAGHPDGFTAAACVTDHDH